MIFLGPAPGPQLPDEPERRGLRRPDQSPLSVSSHARGSSCKNDPDPEFRHNTEPKSKLNIILLFIVNFDIGFLYELNYLMLCELDFH